MASLTRISYYTRKAIVLGIVGVISFFVLKGLMSFGIKQWQTSHPVPTPAPSVLFGKLPKIKFPQSKNTYPSNFVLETIGGELPEASSSAKVFQIPKKLPSLLASRHAREFATRLEFKGNPISKTPTEYKFEDPKTSLRTLDLDIVNYNFSVKYNFLKDAEIFEEKSLPDSQQAKSEAISFFQKTGIFPSELQQGEKKVSFLSFTGKEFLETTSLSRANAVRVDFLRSNVDNYPLLPPEFERSPVFVIFSGSKAKEKRVILAEFNYFEPNYQALATYPIKSAQEAWEELKNRAGFIARWQGKTGKATIRKAYLAYYDSPEYQNFLQPIFVFEGDYNFVAYVPAIKDEWLE